MNAITAAGVGFWHFVREKSLFWPLAGLALVTLGIVHPSGDFPLNDDWIYAKEVQGLLASGRYTSHPFGAPTAVAQIYWGALFCKVFGFSFVVLRASTLVLSVIASWAVARTALAYGAPRKAALLCGALLWMNPIVLNLSYTFMTDVPFLCACALSGLFYVRALERPSAWNVFWGTFLCVIASFVRQYGVLVGAAYVVAAGYFRFRRDYPVSVRMVLAFAAPWLVGAGPLVYMTLTSTYVVLFPTGPKTALETFASGIRYYTVALVYMGFFLLPVAAGRFWGIVRYDLRREGRRLLGVCAFGLCILLLLAKTGPCRMSLLGNILYDLGTGPISLSDALNWKPFSLGSWWWPPTLGAIGASGLLFINGWEGARDALFIGRARGVASARTRQRLFLLLWGVFHLGAQWNPWLGGFVFDRYLIAAIVPFALLLAEETFRAPRKGTLAISVVCCAILFTVSIVCLQDYFACNRARWAGTNELLFVDGVAPEQIDGGFEFNGLYTSDAYRELHGTDNFGDWGDGGFWLIDNTYAVGFFEPRPGYEVIKRKPYFSWLGMEQREVLFFKRVGKD